MGEHELVALLRAGDEAAFCELVDRYHAQLIRLAGAFVARSATAEDVAQETWLALLTGIDRFEERSSLRTWLFQICVNRARSSGARENRTIASAHVDIALEAEQFNHTGAWTSPPMPWPGELESVDVIRAAVAELPAMQRLVVTMRDIDGLTSRQVCEILDLTETNQRVLLHRGRTQVRSAVNVALINH